MSVFQNSVVNKYLKTQDTVAVKAAYEKLKHHFQNPQIQENIRQSKEEQYQGEFLIDLFVNVLGYTKNPTPDFNLTTEYKNVKDSKKADGAIIINEKVTTVIELKGTDTTDLGKIETQAFGYKNNQPECVYVVTSNFEKLRFYIDNAIEHIEFNLFRLTEKEFQLLWLCLAYTNIEKGLPKKIKDESVGAEDIVTKKLYNDYSLFKRELHQNLVALNPQFEALELFKKSQKLLDRFLFLFFAEDRELLPPNSVRLILNDWKELQERDVDIPLYARFKKYFEYLNTGYKGKRYDVFAYNGGLFKPDDVLDQIKINDELLFKHAFKLSEYDFASEVDVNILGHIFENSLNELDEIKAQLAGEEIDKSKTKRKKDGVFYTPKYITKYIVENTLGKLCDEMKDALGLVESEFAKGRKNRKKETVKALDNLLKQYRNWLLEITICDPACGSGAFLNQALDFLIKEHQYIDELQSSLLGGSIVFPDIENHILENNLFGVDLNEESVEIAKLSLWLRTAQPNRKLNDLSNNIKCGNSLIDDPAVAGDKAFDWYDAFPKVFPRYRGKKKAGDLPDTDSESGEDFILGVAEPPAPYSYAQGSKGFEKHGFDVVIGNPPYTYRNAIAENEKDFFKSRYISNEGNFDLYKFFIEKLVSISKINSLSSFIVPNTFLSAITYSKLREIIVSEFEVVEFLDLGLDIFENVVVESVIFTFKKSKQTAQNTMIRIDRERNGKCLNLSNSYTIDLLKYYKKDGAFNIYLSNDFEKIINKCQSNTVDLGTIAYCTVGINTGYIKDELTSDRQIDSRYHKMLNGKNIGRNFVQWDGEWIMYDVDFVKSMKDKGRSLPPEYVFTNDKILVQRTRRGMKRKLVCYFDNEQYYNLNRISNIILEDSNYSLKFIYAIINSELLDFYFNKYFNEYEVKPVHLAKLPIKLLSTENQKPFIENADKMLVLNKELQKESGNFIAFLQSKFNIEKPNTKLENWYELDFKEFLKELKKAKIQLSVKEEGEWMEYFNEQKQKAQALKKQITDTDKEIDLMVYKLYELTYDEVKIVDPEFAITKESYTDL